MPSMRRGGSIKKVWGDKLKDASVNLIEKYIEYATIEGETKLNGDYKKGNKMARKLNKIFKVLENDNILAEEVIQTILNSTSVRARSLAAADALRLNIYVDDAIKVLEEISLCKDIFGFSSQMTLRVWRGEFPGNTL